MTRLTNEQSRVLQEKAKQLYANGFNKKEIAEKLQVTPKTIARWLKQEGQNIKELQEIQTNLIRRINNELTKKTICAIDVFYLLKSLKMYKKLKNRSLF